MKPAQLSFFASSVAALGLGLAAVASAQDDHLIRTPADSLVSQSMTETQLRSLASRGFRPTDIERTGRGPLYTAVMVRNVGAHHRTWWWYPDVSARELKSRIAQHQARLTDVEVFKVNGSPRFSALLVKPPRGDTAKGIFMERATNTQLYFTAHSQLRIIDAEPYLEGSNTFYAAALVENVGVQKVDSVFLENQTPKSLATVLSTIKMRAYALERSSTGLINCVAVELAERDSNLYALDLSPQGLTRLLQSNKTRVTDIELRPNGLFDVVFAKNGGFTTSFGSGCGGSNRKTPRHTVMPVTSGEAPRIGGKLRFVVDNLPTAAQAHRGMLNIGYSKTMWGSIPLPFDLRIIGAPGCQVLVAPLVQLGVSGAGSAMRAEIAVPPFIELVGASVHTQYLVVDGGANQAGLTMSNGVTTTIGIQ